MSDFAELLDEFESLTQKAENKSGSDLQKVRREQARVEKLITSITEQAMYTYDADFAECRDIGHQWAERFSHWESNELSRMLNCDRCGSERYDIYTRTGGLIARSYVYPEGYCLDATESNVELAEMGGKLKRYWRATNIQRTIANP